MRSGLALICSAVLAIAFALACSFIPEQTAIDEDGQEFAAHWVVVQFIDPDFQVSADDEERWARAAGLVSGRLSYSENGSSLRRVMFVFPKSYEGLEDACEDLKMMDCVYDALPDPVLSPSDGTREFKFFHDRDLAARNAYLQQQDQQIAQQVAVPSS